MSFLFKNLRLLDPRWKEARAGYEVLIEGDTIKEVSAKPIKAAKAQVVDCGKRTLMPGLIDCHVHVFLVEVNFRLLESMPLTLLTAKSADLIVVEGNPLKKLELFLDQGAHLPVIMKAGQFHKNTLK